MIWNAVMDFWIWCWGGRNICDHLLKKFIVWYDVNAKKVLNFFQKKSYLREQTTSFIISFSFGREFSQCVSYSLPLGSKFLVIFGPKLVLLWNDAAPFKQTIFIILQCQIVRHPPQPPFPRLEPARQPTSFQRLRQQLPWLKFVRVVAALQMILSEK